MESNWLRRNPTLYYEIMCEMPRFWQHVFTAKVVQCDGSQFTIESMLPSDVGCTELKITKESGKAKTSVMLESSSQNKIKADCQMSSDYV